jgi:eukaryotic-like serine/threonine-protein kinase
MYREAVTRLDASSANSLNDAVAHLKLGRALLREKRYAEAERESLFGYEYPVKQVSPNDHFSAVARKDLSVIYDGLHRPDKAAHFKVEMESVAQAKS